MSGSARPGSFEAALKARLNRTRNERELQPFLKKHERLVLDALNVNAWNYTAVLPEFRFGANYRADFLVLSADSGSWHAVFVEMKSHRAPIFTKGGLASKHLNLALRQLDDWERWLERHGEVFRCDLSRYLEGARVGSQCSRVDRHIWASTEILDFRTVVDLQFRVLIGRRQTLSSGDQQRRGSYRAKDREIATYDRLLDVARRMDAAASGSILTDTVVRLRD